MSNLRVYYGFVRIGVRKKQAVSVIFENEPASDRSKKTLNGLQHTYYVRFQTEEEARAAIRENRVLTEYSTMFEHKSIQGSLRKALESNYNADENHVSKAERVRIRQALREGFMSLYPSYKDPSDHPTLF